MEFWDRVKTLIKSKNITQEGLAKAAEINFSNMKQQIFYERCPDAIQATKIASALGTTVEYLVTGEENNPLAEENKTLKEKIQKAIEDLR